MNKGLGKKIIELRKQGFSYRQIELKLGCSKSLVTYHCGHGQKEKSRIRQRKNRKDNVLMTKVKRFVYSIPKLIQKKEKDNRRVEKILQTKIRQFSLTKKNKNKRCKIMFKTKDLLRKIGPDPVCYLTGRNIDLSDGKSYHLDHIMPKSRGGNNLLENCGLACKAANQAKANLTLEEFVQLCKDVVKNCS